MEGIQEPVIKEYVQAPPIVGILDSLGYKGIDIEELSGKHKTSSKQFAKHLNQDDPNSPIAQVEFGLSGNMLSFNVNFGKSGEADFNRRRETKHAELKKMIQTLEEGHQNREEKMLLSALKLEMYAGGVRDVLVRFGYRMLPTLEAKINLIKTFDSRPYPRYHLTLILSSQENDVSMESFHIDKREEKVDYRSEEYVKQRRDEIERLLKCIKTLDNPAGVKAISLLGNELLFGNSRDRKRHEKGGKEQRGNYTNIAIARHFGKEWNRKMKQRTLKLDTEEQLNDI